MTTPLIRRCVFSPYRRGMGPKFELRLHDCNETINGKARLRYRLRMVRPDGTATVLFEGRDFGCSPLHAVDSDATVASIMGFLTARPGDTDPEYFELYTPVQLGFCDEHAEALAAEVDRRLAVRQ